MRAVRLLLILVCCAGCARHAYPLRSGASEVLSVHTADGWRLALHHYPARGTPRPTPVVLCHGVTANLHNWDAGPGSLPRLLAARGFDVYGLELRGSGDSERTHYRYSFDDYVLRDVPAAVDFVVARAPSGQVHWVGHSMGGMVMYGYLQRVGQAKVRSLVAVGSPPLVLDRNVYVRFAREVLFPLSTFFFDRLPMGLLSELGAPFADDPPVPAVHLIWNPDNMAPDTARAVAANGVNDIAANVMRVLVDDDFVSLDRAHDYTAEMRRIEVPVLFVGGSLDALAPPAVLAAGYRAVSSADKRIVVFGKANGHVADYGHVDLALGETAAAEVFPEIIRWLEARP